MELEFINVALEDSYPLWELCKKEGWTDLDYEDWCNNGGELAFFDGDPDMIKVNGSTGYFAKVGNQVFYYFDDFTGDAETILRKFFETFKTGVTLGGESYAWGENPEGVVDVKSDHWNVWEKMETGIAFRGGAGYTYWISDWFEWQCKNLHSQRVAV